MSVPLAYLGVVFVWSTTPLAIKWSGEDVGFLFGVSGRMTIALVVSLALIALWRKQLPRTREALHVYLAVGIPLYLGMTSVYWGAQYISSGLLSVIFGMTPLLTGILAAKILQEKSFTPFRVIGLLLSIAGLIVIYRHSMKLGNDAHLGIIAVVIASFFHSLGTVWMKKVGHHLPTFTANTGGLVVGVFLFTLTWLLFDRSAPVDFPARSVSSIVYLGVIGSVFGAVLYYYALKHVDTGKIALLTLITPVISLLLGAFLNGETVDVSTLIGVAFVLSGLLVYQWASVMYLRVARVLGRVS